MPTRSSRLALSALAALTLSACTGTFDPNPVFRGDLAAELSEVMSTKGIHAAAVQDFHAGHFGNAIAGFREVLKRDSSNLDALNGLGASYDRLGRHDLALQAYERALTIQPESVQTLNNLGYSHLMSHRLDLAYIYLANAQARAPQNLLVMNNYDAALNAVNGESKDAQSVTNATLQPVEEASIPPAGSYAVERVNGRVQALVALAPDPRGSVADHRRNKVEGKAEVGPKRRPTTIRIAASGQIDRPDRSPSAQTALLPVVVTNGTGRARMAARMAEHLQTLDLVVAGLGNAPRFDREKTRLYHPPGQAVAAAVLADQLPAEIDLVATDRLGGVLRLELGADMLDFDARLIATVTPRDGYAEG